MKVLSKQRNSRMCIICGLDNDFGVKAPFYNMEDGSVMSKFRYHPNHQSYPGRVHGGMITAMLDELGLRGLWAFHNGDEKDFGVTIDLSTNFRKPVPYAADLFAGKPEDFLSWKPGYSIRKATFWRMGSSST